MDAAGEPHSVDAGLREATNPAQHRLGPHTVGSRVVVRRLLPGRTGPSGGPAMTDLLGVCTAWEADHCVIEPEDGEPVTIGLHLLVTGKPVPPRPELLARVAPREAQRHGFALFPDLELEPLGAWVLRRSASETARRANSVLAFGPSGVEDDLARVHAHYPRPVAAVLTGSAEDDRLTALGWVPESGEASTLFQAAPLSRVARALRGVTGGPDDDAVRLTERDDGLIRAAVPTSGVPGLAGLAEGGHPASALAAIAEDWVGFRSVEVASSHRRRGLALALMAALVERAAERGARTAYLQVLADNDPALALYERLGFTTHHAYRYLTPG